MRAAVGLMFFFLFSAVAQASVSGKVDSIGFGSFIRLDCWIPMVVQTTSDEDGPRTFDLQVVQYDLDGDQVIYTRPVTVNPGVQSFWACFKPDPINGGLPAASTDNASDLAKRLRIFLADPATGKRTTQIATAGNLPQALEHGLLKGPRGQKLILVVGRSPNVGEFSITDPRPLLGLMEDVLFIRVDPKTLPVDALGYDAVDAIVWTDADIDHIEPGQLRAMRQYVRAGGRLVISQNAEIQRMGKLNEFLPVHIDAEAETSGTEPLHAILTPRGAPLPLDQDGVPIDPWRRVRGPFSVARATPLPDVVVDTWMAWPDKTQTPYIARRLYGNGCVSWIAQDISDPAITVQRFGWPRLWERLMDWRDIDMALVTTLGASERDKLIKTKFNDETSRDISAVFYKHINSNKTMLALLSLAIVFFIGYWCVAGPGSYFVLAARKRAQWSWFVYGAIALAATMLTLVVTQLVLRGAGEVNHVSLVRTNSSGEMSEYVQSRFGVYLPRDEKALIALSDRDIAAPAAITPLVIDPDNSREEVSVRDTSYAVPVEADDAGASVEISVPFRSTLKKLEATWAGKPAGRINGRPVLLDSDTPLSGQLSNNTGHDLRDVILVFRRPNVLGRTTDQFLALPQWKNGLTLNLADEWNKAAWKPETLGSNRLGTAVFNIEKPQRGPLEWAVNWMFEDLRRGHFTGGGFDYDDSSDRGYPRSFPIVSLFDRCPPMANMTDESTRVELFRRGVRKWDCSAAIAGGALVILGQADGPLPMPLTVDGDVPAGTGHSLFQYVVPMDQSHINQPPATQPAAQITAQGQS